MIKTEEGTSAEGEQWRLWHQPIRPYICIHFTRWVHVSMDTLSGEAILSKCCIFRGGNSVKMGFLTLLKRNLFYKERIAPFGDILSEGVVCRKANRKSHKLRNGGNISRYFHSLQPFHPYRPKESSHLDWHCLPFWNWFLTDTPIWNNGYVQIQSWKSPCQKVGDENVKTRIRDLIFSEVPWPFSVLTLDTDKGLQLLPLPPTIPRNYPNPMGKMNNTR